MSIATCQPPAIEAVINVGTSAGEISGVADVVDAMPMNENKGSEDSDPSPTDPTTAMLEEFDSGADSDVEFE